MLVSNFDDHLRDHGFPRMSSAGWSLSPAFDLNPDPRPGPRRLSTAIDYDDGAARLEILLEVADMFRLTPAGAEQPLREVTAATSTWRTVARATGIPDAGIEDMEPAFEHDEAEAARAL